MKLTSNILSSVPSDYHIFQLIHKPYLNLKSEYIQLPKVIRCLALFGYILS